MHNRKNRSVTPNTSHARRASAYGQTTNTAKDAVRNKNRATAHHTTTEHH